MKVVYNKRIGKKVMKICGIYKITNTITGDFYIGSSKDVKKRWESHKWPSRWKKCPNNPMYIDMQEYGVEKFDFQILEEVEIEKLKEKEQKFIETLKPTYNSNRANGFDFERRKEYQKKYIKEYQKSDKCKKYIKEYQKSDKYKEYQKEYQKSDKVKESHKKACNKYDNQLCFYNGELLTLCALSTRFRKAGIPHPTLEAKKYLLNK